MKYFFVGIKGVGMTSIATLYKEWGHDVSGSDTEEKFFTDTILKNLGVSVVSFDAKFITPEINRVIYSSAYGADHPQLMRARELSILCISYAEALAEIFNARQGILVTGTHGKTTSTAMLGRVLEDAGLDPTVICGGELIEWGRTVRAGKSAWVVAEGDEYQAKILALKPCMVLLTNIEYDHPDFYPDEEAYRGVFRALLQSLSGTDIVVAHDNLRDFVDASTHAKKIYFGAGADSIKLGVWGAHNKTNALGVLALSMFLGVAQEQARATLAHFRGTRRRMELYSPENAEIVLIDDYAHHPTEIRATLSAIRERYPSRAIIAAFQPHTYSRTRALCDDFARAFVDADQVIILDVYASAREVEKSIRGEDLFEEVKKHHKNVLFAKSPEEAFEIMKQELKQNSAFVTLGAGNTWTIVERLSKKGGEQ
ncbi:MAG: cyanophycin synthetase [Patescibacteria group bacterium]